MFCLLRGNSVYLCFGNKHVKSMFKWMKSILACTSVTVKACLFSSRFMGTFVSHVELMIIHRLMYGPGQLISSYWSVLIYCQPPLGVTHTIYLNGTEGELCCCLNELRLNSEDRTCPIRPLMSLPHFSWTTVQKDGFSKYFWEKSVIFTEQ